MRVPLLISRRTLLVIDAQVNITDLLSKVKELGTCACDRGEFWAEGIVQDKGARRGCLTRAARLLRVREPHVSVIIQLVGWGGRGVGAPCM